MEPTYSINTDMLDPSAEPHQPRIVPWNVIVPIITFLVGLIFAFGSGWGRSSNSLDNLTVEVSRMNGVLSQLSDKFTVSDKDTSNRMTKIEEEQKYLREQIDEMRARSVR